MNLFSATSTVPKLSAPQTQVCEGMDFVPAILLRNKGGKYPLRCAGMCMD